MEFKRGKVFKKFTSGIKGKRYPMLKENGTFISFEPDEEILEEFVNIDSDAIKNNLQIRAYTNSGLKIHYTKDDDKEIVFYYENGVLDYLESVVKKPFSKPYYFRDVDSKTGDIYEVAMQYTNSAEEKILGYVNSIALSKGVHETGFKLGITRAVSKFMEDKKIFTKKLGKIK